MERSDEAIQKPAWHFCLLAILDCFASLAMTSHESLCRDSGYYQLIDLRSEVRMLDLAAKNDADF